MRHTSLNGVVTAASVDTVKVVDADILWRKCSCPFNDNVHCDECSGNYFGIMDEWKLKVHFVSSIAQRALKLKLKFKGKTLEDKKSVGGCNRLTDAEIGKLQKYYGLAVRNNSGYLSAMRQAI
ncbi:hypothetical protein TNCV_3307781 [Trichonephila clavipes]|nr:hypothetical protein TNCV_3307781 [Trichonephila clavipes]